MRGFARTLRFKLTASIIALTAMAQLALVLSLPQLRDAYERQQIDALLYQRVWVVSKLMSNDPANRGPEKLRSILKEPLIADQVVMIVRSASGKIIASSLEQGPGISLARSEAGWADDQPLLPVFTTQNVRMSGALQATRDEETKLRVASLRCVLPGQEIVYIQAATSFKAFDAMKSFLWQSMTLAAITSVLAVGVASWIVATILVSRVEKVAKAVTNVTADKLNERVDLPTGDDEVGLMAVQVNAMLERVAAAFLAQERFISHVSHELKTPIAALLAQAQVLKNTKRESDLRAFLHSAEDEMRRLGKLVESFLLLARFGHGKRFFADTLIPVNEIAFECVQHAKMLADQYGVRLRLRLHDAGLDDDAIVRGDPELLGAAVDNLIRNAIQISPHGSDIHVRVERLGNQALIGVRDHGPGIPTEYLERIFDRWTQVPRSEVARTGSGLGLSIAKGVVDLHGGKISAANRHKDQGGGAEFVIMLPLMLSETSSAMISLPPIPTIPTTADQTDPPSTPAPATAASPAPSPAPSSAANPAGAQA